MTRAEMWTALFAAANAIMPTDRAAKLADADLPAAMAEWAFRWGTALERRECCPCINCRPSTGEMMNEAEWQLVVQMHGEPDL